MAKSDPAVAALDAATHTPSRVPLINTFPPEIHAAILRARTRGISYRQIAKILTEQGHRVHEGSVRTWCERNA